MGSDVRVVAEGFAFLEGPRWRGDRLYASDQLTHRVLVFRPGHAPETVCEVEGQPSGIGFTPDGSMLVVSMKDRRLLRLEGTRLIEVADLSDFAPSNCNDMLVDDAGRAYVGNFGFDHGGDDPIRTTYLLRVDPDGSISVAGGDLVFPNGTVLSEDRTRMFVAETFASRISSFAVASDGGLSDHRTWAAFAGEDSFQNVDQLIAGRHVLPDGMAGDAEGALWVADANGDGALRVREGGEIVGKVETGDLAVYAVALGGEDRRTLYMCGAPPFERLDESVLDSASLLACEVEVPGAGLP